MVLLLAYYDDSLEELKKDIEWLKQISYMHLKILETPQYLLFQNFHIDVAKINVLMYWEFVPHAKTDPWQIFNKYLISLLVVIPASVRTVWVPEVKSGSSPDCEKWWHVWHPVGYLEHHHSSVNLHDFRRQRDGKDHVHANWYQI